MTLETEEWRAPTYTAKNQVSGAAAETWAYDPGSAYSLVTCTRSRDGRSLPDYRKRIATGRSATTPFTGTRNEYASLPCIFNYYINTVSAGSTAGRRKAAFKWSHGIVSPALPSSADMAKAENIAATKFYKELDRVVTAFQGGIFLAELRETLHMIRNPAKALRQKVQDQFGHLSRHRGRLMRQNPGNRLKFLSDTWLEWSFGVKPLLNDLDDARQVLDRRQNQLLQELIRVSGSGTVESAGFYNGTYVSGIINVVCGNTIKYTTSHRYIGAVSSRASGSKLLTMSALGLSPRAFVPTLWEAMPYSFLIDYFSNVGDVISAWSNQSVGLAWGQSTVRRSTEVESTRVYSLANFAYTYEKALNDGKTKARNKTIGRSVIGSVPIPTLTFELPGFGNKWINMSALLTARKSLRFGNKLL